MERVPRRDRLTQLGLFCERAAALQWHDLSETMRAEAIKLLAQLLREARRAASVGHSAGGAADE